MSTVDKLLFKINPKAVIERSAYFDKEWYKKKYNIGSDPAKHYLNEGWKLDYNPSERFSSKDYLINNPDIKDVNPLLHYEVFGKYEGRRAFVPATEIMNSYNAEKIDIPYEEYYKKIEEKQVVSFDVFDTLVIRPFVNANEVFDYLEKTYNKSGFAKQRKEAEIEARKQLQKEVNIDEIYQFISDEYKTLKEKEIECEIRFCHLNPQIRPLYDKAKELHKRVIAVSDMYLDSKVIKKILDGSDYVMDEVYVSCDLNKTKGSGELFKEVSEKENIKPEGMVHFGDNYISDFSEARTCGIDAYQTPKIVDSFLSDKKNSSYLSFMNRRYSLAASAYISQMAEHENKKNNDLFFTELGYSLGGPLAMGYLNYLCEKAKEKQIDKLLFVSRDGYALKELYEKYFYDTYRIENEYVYLSRACIYSGSIENRLTEDLKKILSIAKISIPEIEIFETEEENRKEYDKYKSKIDEWSLKQSNNLKKHLEKISGDCLRIATVDMFSGNYTSQKGAKYYLKDRIVTGFYAGNFADNEITHDTYSERLLGMRDNLPVKMSEFLITSYESPICGIDENGIPVYEYAQDENKRVRYEQIMKGIEKYFDDHLRFFDFDERFILSLDEWLDLSDSYLKECADEDIELLGTIIDSENPVADKTDKSISELIRSYREKGY
ncbi:MAG: hypothetical protein IJH00_00295 [Erysipelotrichaceae bacterium]|nr:hypothetical protein [Erysipelotrichaceae bacterium]MBQ6494219.1 hypothetical protein [Erysipelotrichaceae bacterium]